MQARDDERWKQARADYGAEYEDLDPDERYAIRIAAAIRMHEIEREYDPTLRSTEDIIADLRRRDNAA